MPKPKDRERLEKELVKLLDQLRQCEREDENRVEKGLEDNKDNTFEYEECLHERNLLRLDRRRIFQEKQLNKNMDIIHNLGEYILLNGGKTPRWREIEPGEDVIRLKQAHMIIDDLHNIAIDEVEERKKLRDVQAKMARRDQAQEVYA